MQYKTQEVLFHCKHILWYDLDAELCRCTCILADVTFNINVLQYSADNYRLCYEVQGVIQWLAVVVDLSSPPSVLYLYHFLSFL